MEFVTVQLPTMFMNVLWIDFLCAFSTVPSKYIDVGSPPVSLSAKTPHSP
jgi:hypothetical protein